jgi:hypothetical protein
MRQAILTVAAIVGIGAVVSALVPVLMGPAMIVSGVLCAVLLEDTAQTRYSR